MGQKFSSEREYMFIQSSIKSLLDLIALGFELTGVAAILFGALTTFFSVFSGFFRKNKHLLLIDHLRLELGRSIALGLEFFVAGDLIKTVVTPDYYQIGMLSILVIIRTVLTYFLNKELVSLRAD